MSNRTLGVLATWGRMADWDHIMLYGRRNGAAVEEAVIYGGVHCLD
jgi:hypothetical protein